MARGSIFNMLFGKDDSDMTASENVQTNEQQSSTVNEFNTF